MKRVKLSLFSLNFHNSQQIFSSFLPNPSISSLILRKQNFFVKLEKKQNIVVRFQVKNADFKLNQYFMIIETVAVKLAR